MRKLYVGSSATESPQDFKDLVNKLKDELKKEYEVFDVQKSLVRCDFAVFLCDYPSIEIGYELATALEKYSKPTLALARGVDIPVIDHPMYTFKRYDTSEEIASFIKEKELQHFKPVAPVEVCGTDVCAV